MPIPRESNKLPVVKWGRELAITILQPEPTKVMSASHRQSQRRVRMSIDENKRVVRRFIIEVLSGDNVDVMDELLAPNYANSSMGATNRDGIKAVVSGL